MPRYVTDPVPEVPVLQRYAHRRDDGEQVSGWGACVSRRYCVYLMAHPWPLPHICYTCRLVYPECGRARDEIVALCLVHVLTHICLYVMVCVWRMSEPPR